MDTRNREIAVTGIGVLSPYGSGKELLWEALNQGKSVFNRLAGIKTKPVLSKTGGQVPDFKLNTRTSEVVRANRYCQFTYTAGDMAIRDSGLNIRQLDPYRLSVVFGTNCAHPSIERYSDALKIRTSMYVNPNVAPFLISKKIRAKGILSTISSGEHSSASALSLACSLLRWGKCDQVLVGGTDVLARSNFLHYSSLYELSPTGERNDWGEKCTPYDRKRNGTTVSEGSAFVVLEDKQSARNRGAHIYCDILGVGSAYSPDFTTHDFTSGHIEHSMRECISETGASPSGIDLVYGAANGGKKMDKAELKAIKTVFRANGNAPKLSSIKSYIGEIQGAFGIFNLIAAINAFENGVILPIRGFSSPSFFYRDLNYVTSTQPADRVNTILCNAISYTGRSVSFIVGRAERSKPVNGKEVCVA
ncbi:MAG: beta-ketoacyl synthase N-terminal-like domain-containing protein [Pseudomonadota bacterium]